MITTVIGVYSLYILVRLYVSVMQIGYINRIKHKGAVLMGEREYLDAANYAVAKEKLGMMETFVEYGLFLICPKSTNTNDHCRDGANCH